jgi:hypothetical protein
MKDEYGKLGHCEVVNLKIPKSSFSSFCDIYFSLFDQNGDRPDQRGDRGLEYRSVVGIPGGEKSDLYPLLLAAADKSPVNVLVGKGNDPDAPRNTYVMDNKKFPFYLGELYHQVRGWRAGGPVGEERSEPRNVHVVTNQSCPASSPVPRRIREGGGLPGVLQQH